MYAEVAPFFAATIADAIAAFVSSPKLQLSPHEVGRLASLIAEAKKAGR